MTAAVKPVVEARGQFGNPEEGERPPFEAVTRQRLVKTQHTEKTVRAIVKCGVSDNAIVVCLRCGP
jgi:hypothetical protein